MTLGELREALSRGEIAPAYLLAGGEALLRDDALAAIRSAVLGDDPADFDLERLRGESTAPGVLRDALSSLPVLVRRRLVILSDPAQARGAAAKALPEAIVELLPELAEQSTSVLVVVAPRADKRARWVKAFRPPAIVVDCEPARGQRALVDFVRAEARLQGLDLEPGAAELLAERVGPQLLILRRELEKAALLSGGDAGQARVTRESVEAGTSLVAEQPIWDLTDAIGEGRSAQALHVLARLQASGAPAPVVLGALASHFRRLARTGSGRSVPGPPFVVRKLESQSRRYGRPRLVRCLDAIHQTDAAIKGSGALSPEMALERLVLSLSS